MSGILKKGLESIQAASRDMQILALLIFLVGIHSICLGIFIFFFTEPFYRIFFHTRIENLFFVRQSGLFLFCVGLFYLAPLVDLTGRHRSVLAIITTKLLAVLFLVMNASMTPWPPIIFLAAAGDGGMALLLAFFYRRTC